MVAALPRIDSYFSRLSGDSQPTFRSGSSISGDNPTAGARGGLGATSRIEVRPSSKNHRVVGGRVELDFQQTLDKINSFKNNSMDL